MTIPENEQLENPVMMSPFGPNVLKFKLPSDVFTALLKESEDIKSRITDPEYLKKYDWSRYLVGKNTNQLLLDRDFFVQSQLESFLIKLGEFYLQNHPGVITTKLGITSAWLNITRKHDYNSLHDHGEMPLSGIIYLKEDADISKQIDDAMENGTYVGTAVPGVTHFIYNANTQYLDSTSFSFRGKPGDVLIFPGWVSHMVNPFTAEGERMTVAFNYFNDRREEDRKSE
jgi:hypothetical protein